MEVSNCRACGRLFNYIGGSRLCPACKEELEKKFQEVKQYIYDNKSASISEVAEAIDVPISQIKKWVREERLTLTEAMGEIECENCGAAIKTGRFCDNCKKKIAGMLESTYHKKEDTIPEKKPARDAHARMRFLDN